MLVSHAGGLLTLPLLPHDSVQSLRRQLQALGLRPTELSDFTNFVRLQDDQTMEQADIWDGRRPVCMAKAPAAASSSAPAPSPAAAAAAAAAGGSNDAWSLWIHSSKSMKLYVSQLTATAHGSSISERCGLTRCRLSLPAVAVAVFALLRSRR